MRAFLGWLGVTAGVGLLGFGMFACSSTWPSGLGYVALGAWGSALARLSYGGGSVDESEVEAG